MKYYYNKYNIHIIYIYYKTIKKNYKNNIKIRQYCYLTKKKKSILKNFLLSRYLIRLIINKYLLSGFKRNNW
uniref:ribosomal protein S14 n=1 Tax=Balanophora yakushimensis TaxID=1128105 RepID=UPI002001CE4F|nr:ribosomal protein S14 [Balanophora yakushimensis]UNQ87782.1 ribosomal protein S14 [Balanophora yakushimensis]